VDVSAHAIGDERTMMLGRTVRENLADLMAGGGTVEEGRVRAFHGLVEAHLEECYGLANAILVDPSEARDAVHDAFIRAWQHFGSLRDPASFEWWFKRIVVNVCRNRLRSRSRRRTSDLADQPGLRAPDPFPRLHERLRVEAALERLDPDDRVLLALRYYRDLRVEDIAAVLEVPSGTVKSRLARAHERLRVALGAAHAKDSGR
jgi:RNA polymerase sigma-70 factor (ECF subfamily)